MHIAQVGIVDFSVPVGTGLVESGAEEPNMSGCSATDAEPGPLFMVTASFAPTAVIVTVCVELVVASETLTS